MVEAVKIDLRHVARGLDKVSLPQVQAVVELLDEGNTVPFITRYRKDRTGGLDEEAVRHVQLNLAKMRALNERKNQILRSLETRGKLTPELTEQLAAAGTTKRLEDLYLPYRPKKTTLATAAKTRGLEPLAGEILRGAESCADLDGRAAEYVNTEEGVPHAADALLGAGHVIAEWFSENVELRQKLRNLLRRSAKIVSCPASDDLLPEESKKKPEGKADVKPSPEGRDGRKSPESAEETPEAKVEASPSSNMEPLSQNAESPDSTATPASSDATPGDSTATAPNPNAGPASSNAAPPDPTAESPSSDAASPDSTATPASSDAAPADSSATPPTPNAGPPSSSAGSADSIGGPADPNARPPQDSGTSGAGSKADLENGAEERDEPAAETPTSGGQPKPGEAAKPEEPAQPESPSPSESPAPASAPAEPPSELTAESATPAEPPASGKPATDSESTPPSTSATPQDSAPDAEAAVVSQTPATESPVTESPVTESPATESPQSEAKSASSEDAAAAPKPVSSGAPKPKKKKTSKAKAQAKRLTKSQLRKQRAREKRVKAFSDYFDFSEEVDKIPPHRVLALNRGERAKVLRVHFEYDTAAFEQAAESVVISEDHPHREFLRGCAKDALVRLLLPSLERELRRELTEKAEEHAVKVFARNLRDLLLQPPVRDRRVLAIDPGFRNGCKLVALDQFGNVLGHDLIHLVGRTHRIDRAKQTVKDLIDRFSLTLVAIGNGSGCRETEEFVSKLIAEDYAGREIAYVIVNEAGASVYSISRVGREEFPNYDATLRSAISIGRRLQDPLSELVKIDPASIGVGLYQHDVKAKHLRSSLDDVVESAVNFVGVDLNMASPALLRYVSGLNQLTARHVFEHRRLNGPYRNREELKTITGVGQQTYTQSAGFLRLASVGQPFDATWIHPESYPVAEKLLAKIDAVPFDVLDKKKLPELSRRLRELDSKAVAEELGVGEWTLKDLVSQLTRPGRDPREDLPEPVFKKGVLGIEDLEPGMELSGTVLNIVDFGVFVDIGLHDSGLVHVSHLADRFVRDPRDIVAVGNLVKVWVLEIDKERRRVSLTMVPPGASQRPKREKGRRPPRRTEQKRQTGSSDKRRHKGRDGGNDRGRDRGRDKPRRVEYKPKKPPKPVVPITDEMLKGQEAMRTFGDLAQFFAKKQDDDKKDDRGPDAGKPDTGESSPEKAS